MPTHAGTRPLAFFAVRAAGLLGASCWRTPLLGPTGSGGAPAAGGSSGGAGATNQADATGEMVDPGGAGEPVSCAAALVGEAMRGRWIAFDSDREDLRRQIYVMHPDGTNATRLLTDTSIEKEPFFSPD